MTADANPAQTDHPEQSPARTRSEFLARLIAGATAGVFSALLFCELTFLDRAASYVVAAGAVLLALLNLTRFWKTVWAAAAVSVVTILVIGFTPLVPWLLQDPPREAPLERCDAVVSLGAGMNEDGTLAAGTQDRALHSLTLLRA